MTIAKFFKRPFSIALYTYRNIRNFILAYLSQKKLASCLYSDICGGGINWSNPCDLNEKINWLKFNSDTTAWTILADKYRVRKFVIERIGEKYLVPLYKHWYKAEDIDISDLPKQFVLKSNNGAGTVMIVKDKTTLDLAEVRKTTKKWLKSNFGLMHAEPHYTSIKPCIIAEKLLDMDTTLSSSPIDYKIWCFNGKVFGTWVCFNREGFHADTEWHDLDWNFRPEWSVFTSSYRNGHGTIPKPDNYEEMIEVASRLSQGFPQVRVDLYNINGRIYFGEMTFTCAGGHMNFYSQEVLNEMGQLTNIELR